MAAIATNLSDSLPKMDAAASEVDDSAEDVLVHSPVLDLLEEFCSHPSFTGAISDFANENASKVNAWCKPCANLLKSRAHYNARVVVRALI